MSKILANQIANYGDDSPIEIKEGLNIPAGKPLQAAGSAGTSGQVLSTTGSTVQWTTPFDGDYNSLSNKPSIPAAQVNSDWDATSGVSRILNKPTVPPLPTVTVTAAGASTLTYSSVNGEFTYTPPDLSSFLTSYTETSTLDQVLARGSSSSRSISTGAIVAPEITLRNDGTNNGTLRIYDTGSYTRLQFRSYTGIDGAYVDSPDYNLYLFAGNVSNAFVGLGDGNELKCYRNPSKIELNANTYLSQNLFVGSGDSIYFGANNNLRIYSNGSDSYITEGGTGNLYIETNGQYMFFRQNNEYSIVAVANAQVDIYYDNVVKLQTTPTGSQTQGTHNATGGYTVGGSALDLTHLNSVDLSTAPTDGQVLKWEASSSSWKPANDLVGGSGGLTFGDLSVIVAPAGTANLSYNSTNGAFTYTPPDLSGYLSAETDPVFTASAAGGITSTQVSNWDAAYGWGNHAAAGYLSSLGSITTHTDVNVSSPSTGQLLRYNAATTNWENFTPSYISSYTETDTLDSVLSRGSTTTRDITTTGKVYFANHFSDLTALNAVNAGTYHGMFAHVHSEGHGYFAHSGAWTQLLDTGSELGDLSNVANTTPNAGQVLKWSGTQWEPSDDNTGGGGGASVTISDTPPAASAGDLWWESDTGRLKIYYQDTDTSQWVDTNPPLSPALSSNAPASASANGTTGDISFDVNYVYVCVATNTWKRAALATW